MAIGDIVADHCLTIYQAHAHAHKGAFLPVRERDLFCLDPQDTLLGELDPTYQSLIFPDHSLEVLASLQKVHDLRGLT